MRDSVEAWLKDISLVIRNGYDTLPNNLSKRDIIQIGTIVDEEMDILLRKLAKGPVDRMRVIAQWKDGLVSHKFVCPKCRTILDGTRFATTPVEEHGRDLVRFYCPICDKYVTVSRKEFDKGKHSTNRI